MEFAKNSTILILALAFGGGGLACGGSSSLPEDVGEACGDIGSAFCDRGIECGFLSEVDRLSCENAFFQGCCVDDGICNRDLDDSISSSEWDSCIDGFATESCPDLDNGNLPSECIGL
tara:strand:- start:13851 stop:14204 length:354 start_codon:yes stop_codon:yes gene_type:complete